MADWEAHACGVRSAPALDAAGHRLRLERCGVCHQRLAFVMLVLLALASMAAPWLAPRT